MQQGRVGEEGETESIYEAPRETYTRELLSAEPPEKPARDVSGNEIVLEGANIRVWFPIKKA